MSNKSKQIIGDSRQELVNYLIERIETEKKLPWDDGMAKKFQNHNPASGTVYSGVNSLRLFIESEKKKYEDNRWVTFKQGCLDLGLKLKKGSKGTVVEYWNHIKPDTPEFEKYTKNWAEEDKALAYSNGGIRISTYSTVFNAEQFEKFPAIQKKEQMDYSSNQTEQVLESIISNSEAPITYNARGKNAYSKLKDEIYLTDRELFKTKEAFYDTALHEIAHSTGHESRLNRALDAYGKNKISYAEEELVAEFSAAFIKGKYGLKTTQESIDNHAGYLQGWANELKKDPNILFRAVGKAQQAANYIEDRMIDKELKLEQSHEILSKKTPPEKQFGIAVEFMETNVHREVNGKTVVILGGGNNSFGYSSLSDQYIKHHIKSKKLTPEQEATIYGGHIYEVGKVYTGEKMKELMEDIAKDDLSSHLQQFGYAKLYLDSYIVNSSGEPEKLTHVRIDVGDGLFMDNENTTGKELTVDLMKYSLQDKDPKEAEEIIKQFESHTADNPIILSTTKDFQKLLQINENATLNSLQEDLIDIEEPDLKVFEKHLNSKEPFHLETFLHKFNADAKEKIILETPRQLNLKQEEVNLQFIQNYTAIKERTLQEISKQNTIKKEEALTKTQKQPTNEEKALPKGLHRPIYEEPVVIKSGSIKRSVSMKNKGNKKEKPIIKR